VVTPGELREYAVTDGVRKQIVDRSLALAAQEDWIKYEFGSADPDSGGLDCSGAVYFVLRQAGFDPPRTSAGQFQWVRDAGALFRVPDRPTTTEDEAFADLRPGDLLFWSGTYQPSDGRRVPVSHVQIFLGHDRKTGDPLMVGASDGRTFRGTRRAGYGVYDFRLPKPSSEARFLGYGLPTRDGSPARPGSSS
jgi:cell wall-associated NlpC family hydrolase